MKLLRPTVCAVTAFALLIRSPGLAHADPPEEPVRALPPLPGIDPPPQGRTPPAPRTGDTRGDGVTAMVMGTLAIGGGVVLIIYGYDQGVSAVPCSYCSADLGAEVGGVALATAGVVGVILGAVLFAGSGDAPAKKSAEWVLPKPLLPAVPERADTAWVRAPMWREAGRDAVTGVARVGVPIFSHSF
jgi:hypothetical protein